MTGQADGQTGGWPGGQMAGRSPYMQAVHVEAPSELLGEIAHVQVTNVKQYSLEGQLVSDGAINSIETQSNGQRRATHIPMA